MKEQLFLEQPRRGKTHEVQVTPHKRSAVWGISDQRSAVWIRLIPALLFLLILAAAPAYAQDRNDRNNANDHSQIARETHVTATEAMNVGYTFMRTGTGTRGGGTRGSDVRKQAMQLIYTGQAYDSLTGITTDCYYVFALQPKGFVIVAADDRVEPILGYSYDNDFVVANMPDHVRGWFGSYEKQIEAVVKKDIASEAETTAKWSRLKAGQAMSTRSGGTVGPLLTTQWDQGRYYNAMCPEDENGPDGHVLTGCIATAMAQIINYWGYPLHGRGTHGYNSQYGTLEVNYDSADYDYASMPDILTASSTPQEVDAVAQLMYHCGVAVNMGYWASESSSYDIEARAALINYFRFSPNLNYVTRSYFTNHAWHTLLRNNLAANRPIMYSGQGSGGHSFVCDGYMDGNLFHFNFGWGGYCDGWYQTSAVNPDGHDFNSAQTALVGIVPDSTGNIILGQTAGTSSFTVDGPLEFYHLLGHNTYTSTNYYNSCQNAVVFHSADTSKHLALDILSFENQKITVYDNLMGNEIATYSAYTNTPSLNTTSSSLTLLYQGNMNYSGFQLIISQDNGCRMVSDVSWAVDTNTIHLAWHENGTATQWEVEYGAKGFNHGEGTMITAYDTAIDIMGLVSFREYDMYVRPVCDAEAQGLWRMVTVMPEARYWTDVVTSQPEGYVVDSLGNVEISSAEGLAWFARQSYDYWMSNPFLVGHKVVLTNDINLGKYKWSPIKGYFGGEFDGKGHIIDSMYCIVGQGNGSGLFDQPLNAVIRNVNITNCYSQSESYASGLAVILRQTNVANCFVSGKIFGVSAAGGINADIMGSHIQITNCATNCEITANNQYGGIFGRGNVGDGPGERITIRNCYTACKYIGHFGEVSWINNIYGYSQYTSMENCYAYMVGSVFAQPNGGGIGSTSVDSRGFNETDSGFHLVQPIYFEPDNQYYSNLKEALNAGVRKFNLEGWRLWVDDTAGVNGGMPLLGSEHVVSCPNIQDLSARNVVGSNGEYGVELSWTEMGDANAWEIDYHAKDSINVIRATTTNHPDTLWNLTEQTDYVIHIRPRCDVANYGGWGDGITHIFDRPYWSDIVTSQPDGYGVDDEGNITISSAEGLAWLISVVNGLNGQTGKTLHDKRVFLSQNIDIGQYKWKAINGFTGLFDGGGHTISNLYIRELSNEQGLFGNVVGGSYLNVHISNANVKGESYIGILAGYAKNVTIANCHTSGTVHGDSEVGGLVGVCDKCGWVNACSSSGEVFAEYDRAGGLFGMGGYLRNCFSRCNVTANRYDAGGLAGTCGYLENCYAIGNVNGSLYKGGLTGSIGGHLKNCYAAGTISTGGYACMSYGGCGFRAGVLTGTTSNNLLISNCYGLSDNYRPLYGIDEAGTIPIVSNTVPFIKDNDILQLSDSITVGDNRYAELLDALNAWVDANDTIGLYLHWMADTTGINNGFPCFDSFSIIYYNITLAVADSTPFGTVQGSRSYCNSEPAIISAIPQYGYHFAYWNDGNTDNPRIVNLSQDTIFIAVFEKNMYSIVGTAKRWRDYSFDFDNISKDDQWTFINGDFENRWCIAPLEDTLRALFISNDNGLHNAYSGDAPSDVFAYTSMFLEEGSYTYSYDIRCEGRGSMGYMKIALFPDTMPLSYTGWTWGDGDWGGSVPDGAIQLASPNHLSDWTNIPNRWVSINNPGEYKLVIYWHNQPSTPATTSAAIDNIRFSKYRSEEDLWEEENTYGYVLGSDTVPYLDTVMLTAVPYEGYQFASWHDGNTDNPRALAATKDLYFIAHFECAPISVFDSIEACGSFFWKDSVYFVSTTLYDTLLSETGCDSIVAVHLAINQPSIGDSTAIACDSYTWNSVTYTQSGDYTQTLTNSAGCDSVVTLHLTVNYSNTGDTTALACESFTWYGTTYTESGNYTFSSSYWTNAAGCDSVVTLHLTINNPAHTAVTETACESFTWNGTEYTASGDYTYIHADANGCTQVDTLHLTITNTDHTDFMDEACDSYTWNGETYTQSGTYSQTFTNLAGCDSMVTLHLTINNPAHTAVTETACESFTWNGTEYTASGDYTYIHADANGCTQVDTLHLTITNTDHTDFTDEACDSYTWNGETYTQSGTYSQTFTNLAGCDSVVTLHLIINNPVHTAVTETACESFTWNGTTYTVGGDYTYIHEDANGCTQVDTLHLTITNTDHTDFMDEACDSYTWNGETYTQSGTYSQTFTNLAGCDSMVTLHLTINNPAHTAVTETACESFTWNGTEYTASGDYTYIHADANGCTQVDTLHLTITNTDHTDFMDEACDSYTWNGETYTQSGTYSQTFTNLAGCDSMVTLHLTINNPAHTAVTETACESFTWNGTTYTVGGDYTYSHEDANGCTQVDTLHLTITNTDHTDFMDEACDSYTWNGETYTQSGTYSQTFTNLAGCDSMVTLHLTINNPAHTAVTETACESFTWNGTEYTASGDYTYIHADANGCTQVDTLHLTITNTDHTDFTDEACDSYTWNGETYTQSGTYSQTFTNLAGCDSMVTLHLSINNPAHTAVTETVCESFTWNGTEYTASGDYTYIHADANGCTQVDTLHLTITNTDHTNFTDEACDSYTWNGVTYTQSGDYTQTLTNSAGCDSVVTLHLIINNPVHTAVTETVCESFTWNGTEYTASGDYTYIHADANGCTQVDTLHLTITNTDHTDFTDEACDSYTWNGETYTQSGTYSQTFTNLAGCDSMVTLHLTINNPAHTAVTETACESFTWNGTEYTASGDYTYIHADANGCTQVDTLHLTITNTDHTDFMDEACDSYTWNGETYTQSGTYSQTFTNLAGCDSMVTLHLTINNPAHTAVTETACESFTWNGTEYTASGDYTYIHADANGCTQVDTLHLTITNTDHTNFTDEACDSYTWNGVTYTQSGDYTQTLTNSAGCDSVVTLHLIINNPVHTAVTETACESFTWNGTTYTVGGDHTYSHEDANGCTQVDTLHLTITNTDHTDFMDEACDSYTLNNETYTQSGDYTQTFANAAGCDSVVTLHLTIFNDETSDFTIVTEDSCYTWNGTEYCASGDYTQTFQTVHGCDSVVTLHLTITVGIDDHDGFDFRVYPNPTYNIVNVQITNHHSPITEIHLVDAYGRLLRSTHVVETQNFTSLQTAQIDLSRYANGVYFVKAVADGETVAVRKIVKN